MNIYVSPNILIIVGLACNILGAILISLEAFGIKEFIEKLHNESTYEHRLVATSYIAMVNEFSVFVLVNCLWVIALVVFANFPVSLAALLFPAGFFLWKFIVKTLELLSNTIRRLAPKYRKGEGWLKWIAVFLPLLVWAFVFGFVSLIHIVAHFGIDLPLRFLAEKVLSKWLLSLFEYIKNILDKSHRTHLKAPILFGAALLIFGFVYQLLGITLIMLGQ